MRNEEQHNLTNSEVVEAMPLACSDELAAVELFEEMRWAIIPLAFTAAAWTFTR